MDPQNTLTEQAHQIVHQHDHAQRRLGTVKNVQAETVKTEIVFEFIDPILRVRMLLIKIPHLLRRQGQIGDETMVPVTVVHGAVLKSLNGFPVALDLS